MSPENKKILVIDDDMAIRESLSLILSRVYSTEVVSDGKSALKAISSNKPDLLILDLMMPGMSGIELLGEAAELYPEIPVIMLTASKGITSAVQAMKLGAIDYLSKPFDVDELLSLIEETLEQGSMGRGEASKVSTHSLSRPKLIAKQADYGALIGEHSKMHSLFAKIDRVAPIDTTVFITGESGVGKNLVANEIHKRSARGKENFVNLECASANIDADLFGLENLKKGRLELADGGTLFLDEVSALNKVTQSRILRFLETKEFFKLGETEPTKVDVRIIASSNVDLEQAVSNGSFRKDLFYRLNVVTLEVPALRERVGDIERLIEFFQKNLSPLFNDRTLIFSDKVIEIFKKYRWQGNVRELENVVESMLALCLDEMVTVEQLPKRMMVKHQPTPPHGGLLNGEKTVSFEQAGQALEKELILEALVKTNFIQTKAAKLLGISRRVLKYRMDKLGINKKTYAAINYSAGVGE